MPNNFKSLTVKMKADDIAVLNQRLKQCGFETLGDLARAFANGMVTSKELVQPLADQIAVKLLSNNVTVGHAMPPQAGNEHEVMSLGRDLIPRPIAYKASEQSRLSRLSSKIMTIALARLSYRGNSEEFEGCQF